MAAVSKKAVQLVAKLRAKSSTSRDEVVAQLVELGSDAVPPLLKALDSKDYKIRIAAAEALGARVVALGAGVQSTTTRVEELQQAHERRLYTLKGLRDVCSRLGFAEVGGPRYESQRGDSAIVLTVDTRSKGRITFKLGIDAQIETDSKMNPKYCASEFGRLSAELMTAYGIQSQFARVEADAKPKRRTYDAEDEPEGAPAAQSQEW